MINNIVSYSELIEISKKFNLGFHLEQAVEDSLKLSNHYHPWSLREPEANIVYDLVYKNNVKYGFEIATAFGISSCVIGQALSKTGGKLVTMDAYVEEQFNNSLGYDINTKLVSNTNADGYQMAKCLIEELKLSEHVQLEIGWSPDDTPSIIKKAFGESKLDFAFIDGGHSAIQIDNDVKAIFPYLDYHCVLLFHDHDNVPNYVIDFVRQNGFNNVVNYNTGFKLWAYARGNKHL